MKKSVIKDIFHGLRGSVETMEMPNRISRSAEIDDDVYEILKEKSPELLELFEKLLDGLEVDWSDEVDYFFVEGFKLGLLIGIECSED